MRSLRVKIKLTVTVKSVRPGSKVKYNEGKYKLTRNYIDRVDKNIKYRKV